MSPEPCRCCEEPHRTPSIRAVGPGGNESQGLSDSAAKARNSAHLEAHEAMLETSRAAASLPMLHVNV